MEFAYDGGGMGKGGDVTLYCDGKEVGKGRVDQTQGFVFSADETTDSATNPALRSAPTTPRTPASSTARSTGYGSIWATTPRTPTTTSSQTNASGSRWRGSSQVCDLAPTMSWNRAWRSASSRGSLYRWKPALFIA